MAEEFDHLYCPICGSELVYSEGTHDLGCMNNPKPCGNNTKSKSSLHEGSSSYGPCSSSVGATSLTDNLVSAGENSNYKSYKLCNIKQHKSEDRYKNVCELPHNLENLKNPDVEEEKSDFCVFGMSFTESAKKGTLWSIRIIDGETNYAALMRLMQTVEKRVRAKQALAENVPNLPKKIERNKVTKLAFRYNLEIEDLYSIKYSTETIERLALFYNLTNKEIRHIKQSDVMEE
ncbi:MAG: hypothetical protein WBB48_02710 [Thermodesulfobacteriota bacterium]